MLIIMGGQNLRYGQRQMVSEKILMIGGGLGGIVGNPVIAVLYE